MDPITQRILDQQTALSLNPEFQGYKPSDTYLDQDLVNLQSPDTSGIKAFQPDEQSQPNFKNIALNTGKNVALNYGIKKLGLDGLQSNVLKSVVGGSALGFSNPLTAAFTIGSFLPDSVKGIAGLLRGKRAQKAINKNILNDNQGQINTVISPNITNMQQTAQDRGRGDRPGGANYSSPGTSAPTSAPTQSRHTSGTGGLHSGY